MGMFDGVLGLKPTHLCKNCGNQVRPSVTSKVNGCFFIVLLFFFVIPGILYLVWAGMRPPPCRLVDVLSDLVLGVQSRSSQRRKSASTAAGMWRRLREPGRPRYAS